MNQRPEANSFSRSRLVHRNPFKFPLVMSGLGFLTSGLIQLASGIQDQMTPLVLDLKAPEVVALAGFTFILIGICLPGRWFTRFERYSK